MNWDRVDEALRNAALSEGDAEQARVGKKKFVFPGAVLHVSRGGETLYEKAVGLRSVEPSVAPLSVDCVYDVASLTKAFVTSVLTMKLVEAGLLNVDHRLSRVFQTFASHGKERVTVRHLLTHSSGYPAHAPYYRIVANADASSRAGIMATRAASELVYTEIFRSRLENVPGKLAKYSDIGFILLGRVIEVTSGGAYLDRIAHRQIFHPLELRHTGFVELEKLRRRGLEPIADMIAPTNRCGFRKKLIVGEVQDENAWVMGGIAGHAGLFTNVSDLAKIARELVECWHGRGKLVNRDVIREFWKRDETVAGSTWALGWDMPSAEGSSAGKRFSRNGVGHLGYTGCSAWIDPEKEIVILLLSNRVHPTVENNAIKDFRPLIHDLVMETVGA